MTVSASDVDFTDIPDGNVMRVKGLLLLIISENSVTHKIKITSNSLSEGYFGGPDTGYSNTDK